MILERKFDTGLFWNYIQSKIHVYLPHNEPEAILEALTVTGFFSVEIVRDIVFEDVGVKVITLKIAENSGDSIILEWNGTVYPNEEKIFWSQPTRIKQYDS